MGNGGFILLHRSVQAHWVHARKPFCEFGAWVDLLLRASWCDHSDRHGRIQKRGEVSSSQVALGDAWGWKRKKVKRFLARLQADGMVNFTTNRNRDTGGTFIAILNYGHYQATLTAAGSGPEVSRTCPVRGASKSASNHIEEAASKCASNLPSTAHLPPFNGTQLTTETKKEKSKRETAPPAAARFKEFESDDFLDGDNRVIGDALRSIMQRHSITDQEVRAFFSCLSSQIHTRPGYVFDQNLLIDFGAICIQAANKRGEIEDLKAYVIAWVTSAVEHRRPPYEPEDYIRTSVKRQVNDALSKANGYERGYSA
ncbi:MAG TPA: hypothetical protein VGP72_31690 [Planctomycetota bacterium]|jgi:hypothetical protein